MIYALGNLFKITELALQIPMARHGCDSYSGGIHINMSIFSSHKHMDSARTGG
jgi:hypothetical protein